VLDNGMDGSGFSYWQALKLREVAQTPPSYSQGAESAKRLCITEGQGSRTGEMMGLVCRPETEGNLNLHPTCEPACSLQYIGTHLLLLSLSAILLKSFWVVFVCLFVCF
jgi:hypothetical protein